MASIGDKPKMITIDCQDIENFRALVASKFGLHFDAGKNDFLQDILRRRIEAGFYPDAASYIQSLELTVSQEETRKLVEELTVTETFFFRNENHFRALIETVLPERIRAQTFRRRLSLLSAGCASGEEPYSMAMVLKDHFPELASWEVSIRGVDVNATMLRKAALGRYSVWALRDTPSDIRDRYFQSEGREHRISKDIQSRVNFEERNLAETNADLWIREGFDVIFCRNVIMYLVPEAARKLVARLAEALVPGGFLFLGHAETLRGLSQAFHLCHTHGTFYYQKREAVSVQGPPSSFPGQEQELSKNPEPFLSVAESSAPWVEIIQRASERIHGLAAEVRKHPQMPATSLEDESLKEVKEVFPSWDLGKIMELLRQERFSDALAGIQNLPVECAKDSDVQLVHAALLTNLGELKEAESVCLNLLLLDELNAGAHYLVALCKEHAGDHQAAQEHDQSAVYLDDGFAMPRFHLGLLAKRNGHRREAREHLDQALLLLAREDPSRILLFGGGFSRDALIQLCRSEIRTLQGAR